MTPSNSDQSEMSKRDFYQSNMTICMKCSSNNKMKDQFMVKLKIIVSLFFQNLGACIWKKIQDVAKRESSWGVKSNRIDSKVLCALLLGGLEAVVVAGVTVVCAKNKKKGWPFFHKLKKGYCPSRSILHIHNLRKTRNIEKECMDPIWNSR